MSKIQLLLKNGWRFSVVLLALGIIGASVAEVFYPLFPLSMADGLVLGFTVFMAGTAALGVFLKGPRALLTALSALAVLAGFYLFEIIQPDVNTAPEDQVTPYMRAYLEEVMPALADVRKTDPDATIRYLPPNFTNYQSSLPLADGSNVLPLSGPSDRTIVMCREGNRPFSMHRADSFGMNNPESAWAQPPLAVFLGDSFTYGMCVAPADHFVEIIRQHYPAIVNLAMGGHGPLTMLASLREYAVPLKPHFIFWIYFEGNDLQDLEVEKQHSILRKYLEDPAFTQHLRERQKLINQAINARADYVVSRQMGEAKVSGRALDILSLHHVRRVIRTALSMPVASDHDMPAGNSKPASGTSLDSFSRVLRMAKDTVAGWGGQLVFVNLPSLSAYCRGGRDPKMIQAVFDVPAKLGLPVIDLSDPLLEYATQHGPETITSMPPCNGHLSEKANALIADVLQRYLESKKP